MDVTSLWKTIFLYILVFQSMLFMLWIILFEINSFILMVLLVLL